MVLDSHAKDIIEIAVDLFQLLFNININQTMLEIDILGQSSFQ